MNPDNNTPNVIGASSRESGCIGAESAFPQDRAAAYRAIFENSIDAVLLTTPDGRVAMANSAAVGMFGYSEAELRRLGRAAVVDADDPRLETALQERRRRGRFRGELTVKRKDGTRLLVEVSSAVFRDEQGAEWTSTFIRDITERKRRTGERALRQAIEDRQRVLGIVAHDLRNPLQVILFQLELLVRLNERRTDYRNAMQAIRSQAKRMDRLIQDLLDATRIESGTFRLEYSHVNAQELVEEVLFTHREEACKSSLDLTADVQGRLPDISADRGRLVQVFDNLVANAVKFTPRDGSITVGARAGDDEVIFFVADTGIGMDKESLTRVFDRLWQADTDRRGLGLGLSIAKSIVDSHGGRIWVESAVARGSTFFFALPAPLAAL